MFLTNWRYHNCLKFVQSLPIGSRPIINENVDISNNKIRTYENIKPKIVTVTFLDF